MQWKEVNHSGGGASTYIWEREKRRLMLTGQRGERLLESRLQVGARHPGGEGTGCAKLPPPPILRLREPDRIKTEWRRVQPPGGSWT